MEVIDPEVLRMISPIRPKRIIPNGFTGKQWVNRKSRNKITKASRKRNR